jgi:hypothetical protein
MVNGLGTQNTCATTQSVSVVVNTPTFTSALSINDMVWKGASTNDWSNASNWWKWDGVGLISSSAVPTQIQNVIIPANQTCVLQQPNTLSNSGNARNLTIETGAILTMGTGELNVSGNWSNNGVFNPGTGTVNFNGSSAQSVNGTSANRFYKLESTNSSSGTTLNTPVFVSNSLILNSGDLYTNALNLLTLGDAAYSGDLSWASGTIVGPFRRWFSAAVNSGDASSLFPIGNKPSAIVFNRSVKIEYTAAPTVAGYLTAQFIGSNPLSTTAAGNGLPLTDGSVTMTNMASEGYWEIDPSTLIGGSYLITARANQMTSILNSTQSRIIKSPSSHLAWELDGVHGTITGAPNDFTISRSGLAGYSYFAIAYPTSLLPVELVFLSAECDESGVSIVWKTASEYNSDHFSIYRSRNGQNWEKIGTVGAAGNSSQVIEYTFLDPYNSGETTYYRIIQADIDGTLDVFPILTAECEFSGDELFVFPNPTVDEAYVRFISGENHGSASLVLVDLKGDVLATAVIEIVQGNNVFPIPISGLEAGMYLVRIIIPGEDHLFAKFIKG